MDHSSKNEFSILKERISTLLNGKDDKEPAPGFYYQVYMIRQDALACAMPSSLYQHYVDAILDTITASGDEKRYNAPSIPPPFSVYKPLRRITTGGMPFAKYLCMQKNYRSLPEEILCHPAIIYLQDLASTLVGYHNDIVSLPKELGRKGDVLNIIMTLQHEFGLNLKDAYAKSMEIHDTDLAEFISLQNSLPDFGEKWQLMAQEYVTDIGVMLQGIYSWHVKGSGRYVPDAYVEPEVDGDELSLETD